jgi:deazaflavin-dependent oxidoreductase (nitroreductase family)
MPLTGTYVASETDWARQQAETYEATNGERAGTLNGRPVIVLTYVGAQSGFVRKTPLMRIEFGGCYAIVASNGGSHSHPTWYRSVAANPHVEIQDRERKADFFAHEADGEERECWWDVAVQAWPDFSNYIVGLERRIPLFVLTPLPPRND